MVRDASANYSDFPVGLSHLKGELVFDSSRLIFENITADSGGGQLTLGGSVTYGDEGPVRYEIYAADTTGPRSLSSGDELADGRQVAAHGDDGAAVLSGNVELKRLLFAPGADITSFFSTSPDTSAAASVFAVHAKSYV